MGSAEAEGIGAVRQSGSPEVRQSAGPAAWRQAVRRSGDERVGEAAEVELVLQVSWLAELEDISFDDATPPGPTTTLVSYVFATSTVDGVSTGTLTRHACEATPTSSYPWKPADTTVVARTLAATVPTVRCSAASAVGACSAASTAMTISFARLSGDDPFVVSGTRRTTP